VHERKIGLRDGVALVGGQPVDPMNWM